MSKSRAGQAAAPYEDDQCPICGCRMTRGRWRRWVGVVDIARSIGCTMAQAHDLVRNHTIEAYWRRSGWLVSHDALHQYLEAPTT